MKRIFTYLLIFLPCLLFAQNEDVYLLRYTYKYRYLPEVGFSSGLMSFVGDVGYKNIRQPIRYRLGYTLSLQKSVLSFLDVSAYLHTGRLYGNEWDTSFVYNFQSTVYSGGLNIIYNFSKPFYSKSTSPPFVSPFVLTGIELVSYDSNSDLKDANGKTYYYWTDGSIRDKYQYASFASSAVKLQRDYNYETNAVKRTSAIAFPIGGGLKFRISNRMSLDLGTTLHITNTDLIDNFKSANNNDYFLYSYAGIHYNLGVPTWLEEKDASYKDVNFKALDQDDSDADGVSDLNDRCPGTPAGEKVDVFGCPADDDGDGIPNYADKQANTAAGALVDEQGVEITEEYLASKIAQRDSIRSATTERNISFNFEDESTGSSSGEASAYIFMVQLGKFKSDGIPSDLIEKIMSIQDVTTKTAEDGTTSYTVGSYRSKLAAESRLGELKKDGIKDAFVIATDKDGKPVDLNTIKEITGLAPGSSGHNTKEEEQQEKTPFSSSSSYDVEFRVQLGAYSKTPAPGTFSGVTDLTQEPAPNGSTRYLSGKFSSYAEATAYRETMIKKGFGGAFVAVYKNGKRVTFKSINTGENEIKNPPASKQDETSLPKPSPSENRNTGIIFKVQLGAFKNEPSAQQKNVFSSIQNVQQEKTGDGITRYTAGTFSNYESANRFKEEALSKGANGAFVIAFKDGRKISIKEAIQATGR